MAPRSLGSVSAVFVLGLIWHQAAGQFFDPVVPVIDPTIPVVTVQPPQNDIILQCPSAQNQQTTSVVGDRPYQLGPITVKNTNLRYQRAISLSDTRVSFQSVGVAEPVREVQQPTSLSRTRSATEDSITLSGFSLPQLGQYSVLMNIVTKEPNFIGGDSCSFDLTLISVGSAGAVMDPHFTGFHGEQYDFHGYGGAYFNLLSDHEHKVNAKFEACTVEDRPTNSNARYCADVEHEVNGTVMREIGLVHRSDMARVWLEDSGSKWSLRVEALGREMQPGEETVLADGTFVHFELPNPSRHAHEVILITPTYKFRVLHWIEKTWETDNLDLCVDLLEMPSQSVHGIIGQTLFAVPLAAESAHDVKLGREWLLARDAQRNSTTGLMNSMGTTQANFIVEGQDRNYQVSGVFSHDSAFNRFTYSTALPATLTTKSRRLLVLDGKPPIKSAFSGLRKF